MSLHSYSKFAAMELHFHACWQRTWATFGYVMFGYWDTCNLVLTYRQYVNGRCPTSLMYTCAVFHCKPNVPQIDAQEELFF